MTNLAPAPLLETGGALGTKLRSKSATASQNRERLRSWLASQPLSRISPAEVDAHFYGMPTRYWERITRKELTWGLETIHRFFEKLALSDAAWAPVSMTWHHNAKHKATQVLVSTWDRPGLLTGMAASFASLGLNIMQADVFTRADQIVLDVFQVCDAADPGNIDPARLRHAMQLLEGLLNEPDRVALCTSEFRNAVPRRPDAHPKLECDNQASANSTVLRLEAGDRLGLLYDVLNALNTCQVNIAQAVITTSDNLALDVFYATDLEGGKIVDPARIESIRQAVVQAAL